MVVGYERAKGDIRPLVEKNEYSYSVYNLIPDRFINDSGKVVEEILKSLSALQRPSVRLDKSGKAKVVIDPDMPIHYEILVEGGKINFYYVLPGKYEEVLVNKVKKIYRSATFKPVDDYVDKFKNTYMCPFLLKRHFVYSLDVDYRENGLIEGLLSVVSNIKKEDRVLLQISILPLNDSWKESWKAAYTRYKRGEDLEVSHGIIQFLLDKVFSLGESSLGVLDMVLNSSDRKDYKGYKGYDYGIETGYWGYKDYEVGSSSGYGVRGSSSGYGVRGSSSGYDKYSRGDYYRGGYNTRPHVDVRKISYDGFEVQIRLYCNDYKGLYYYTKVFDGVFKILDGGQQIVPGSIKKVKEIDRKMEFYVNKQILSTKEAAVFLQQPNRRLQLDFRDNLKSIENIETKIPEQLRDGDIPIGEVTYKGEKFMTYWNTRDKHMAPMHKIITGLQRTGKTSYITNYAVEALKAGHSVFVIDTIKGCELANNIRDYIPEEYKKKIIVLDFSNLDWLVPLAWNEITGKKAGSQRERLKIASMVAGNFEYFLETVGELKSDAARLSPKMKRYLSSACKLVMSIEGTSIKDVLDCLMYVDSRRVFIEKSGLSVNSTIVQDLLQLDGFDEKTGESFTRYSEISGIVDRVSILFNDYMMELLLSVKNNGKVDFRKWADEGYCVLLKMSELEFSRSSLKTLVTLIYSKIWMAMLSRGYGENHRLVHVILDEVHNFPQVTEMLKLNCREAAKYGLSYVFTSHLLIDLRSLLPYIKGSGANFMLFKTTKENFKLLEEELQLGGFELEDCMRIKDYHTINIVNYDRDYVVFTSKVIDPIDKRYTRVNREYIDKECLYRYGVKYVE